MRVSMRAAAVAGLWFLVACVQLPVLPELATENAIAPAGQSALDLATAASEESNPGQSAFRLVVEGNEAFVSRMQSARMAERSLDVQSYIWHADVTGRYLAQELLLAADRGVRVRVLLDDLDARQHNDAIAALAAHPNIQVRSFNPYASRRGMLRFVAESVGSFRRINRRMHNKSWIADNRLAIVGGRNIGDEYFAASDEVNFIDLDFAMIGPVVRDASASFDRYWNSPSAYPIEVLDPEPVTGDAIDRFRQRLVSHAAEAKHSRYATALRADEAIQRMVGGDWPMEWAGNFEFVSDDPRKVTMSKQDLKNSHVGAALAPMIEAARVRLTIIAVLAQQLEQLFDRQTAGQRAWRVSSEAGKLHWTDDLKRFDRDPDASLGRRFQAWLARFLRLDAQL